jgi:hypothetical protein
VSEETYNTESTFGPNAGVEGDETSYQADIDAGYDDEEDNAHVAPSDAGEGVSDSHEADVAAGFDRGVEDDSGDRA